MIKQLITNAPNKHNALSALSYGVLLKAYLQHKPQYPFKRAKQGYECVLYYPITHKVIIGRILSESVVLFDMDKTLFLNTDTTGISEFVGEMHDGWFNGGWCHIITDLNSYMRETSKSILTMCGYASRDIMDIIDII